MSTVYFCEICGVMFMKRVYGKIMVCCNCKQMVFPSFDVEVLRLSKLMTVEQSKTGVILDPVINSEWKLKLVNRVNKLQ